MALEKNKMKNRIPLTKEFLQMKGVVDVHENGDVFNAKGKAHLNPVVAKHPYGQDRTYYLVYIGGKHYCVHRVVYAWFFGECPVEMDIDHIDGDPANNAISNLRLLTRELNLGRKTVSRNQYNAHLTDEEILQNRKYLPSIYDRKEHKMVKNPDYIPAKIQAEIDAKKIKLNDYKRQIRDLRADTREKRQRLRELHQTDGEIWRLIRLQYNPQIAENETKIDLYREKLRQVEREIDELTYTLQQEKKNVRYYARKEAAESRKDS